MLEFLGRFVVDVLFQGLVDIVEAAGRAITRMIVPPLTAGRVRVEPLCRGEIAVRRWHGVHRLTDGTPVIGEGLAGLIGILLIAMVVTAVIVFVKYA